MDTANVRIPYPRFLYLGCYDDCFLADYSCLLKNYLPG